MAISKKITFTLRFWKSITIERAKEERSHESYKVDTNYGAKRLSATTSEIANSEERYLYRKHSNKPL